ncbi:MAG: hypothetical protein AB7K24_25460, partial [Gemmataceae bacterium]
MPKLITALLGIFVCTAALARADDVADRVEALVKKRGGTVTRATVNGESIIVTVSFYEPDACARVTDADVKEIVSGSKQMLYFYLWKDAPQVTDAGIKELAACPNLNELRLAGTKVIAAGLKELTSFKRLRLLDLSGSTATGKDVKVLAGSSVWHL